MQGLLISSNLCRTVLKDSKEGRKSRECPARTLTDELPHSSERKTNCCPHLPGWECNIESDRRSSSDREMLPSAKQLQEPVRVSVLTAVENPASPASEHSSPPSGFSQESTKNMRSESELGE